MVWRGFINSFSCIRNYVTLKSLLTFCRLTCIINLVIVCPPTVAEYCLDVETLKSDAEECFRPYGTQKLNVDRSEQKLFSGIDIEILRTYCSSYLEAMQCVSKLIAGCPKSTQKQVEESLVNYNGIQEELTNLCTTQRLYELYAQYMTCYFTRGQKSEWCYKANLNNTVPNIYTPPTEEFCGRVQEATFCIENNIRQWCGEQAKELVHLLVQPTVSGSAQCKYNIVEEKAPETVKTVSSGGGNGTNKPKERATSSQSHNSHSSAASGSANIILILISLYLSYIAHSFKPRGLS